MCSGNQYFLCIALLFSLNTVSAQSTINTPDTVPQNSFWQKKAVRISIAPAALLTASALTWGEREEIRKFRNRYIPTFRHHYDDYLQYVPAIAVFGLNAAGVEGKHTVKRAFVSYLFSAVTMGVIVNSIKYTAKVERPSGGERNSFPSGHTANSFMNATFLNKEYGQYRHPLYGVGAYAAATATAIGRQLNNRHWVSDVLAGAGIGILSTELGYVFADKVFKEKGTRKPLRLSPFPVNEKPSFLEIRLGYSVALHRDLLRDTKDTRVKHGFNMGLEGAWFFSRNAGIGGEFAFTSFPVKLLNPTLENPVIDSLGKGYYFQPLGVRYLQAGPYFSIPLTHNWFITAKATAGTSVGAQGDVQLELRDDIASAMEQPEIPLVRYKPGRSFSWSTGAGIQKRIGRNVALKLSAAYFHSQHDFEIDLLNGLDAEGKPTFASQGKDHINFEHLTVGLGLTAFIW